MNTENKAAAKTAFLVLVPIKIFFMSRPSSLFSSEYLAHTHFSALTIQQLSPVDYGLCEFRALYHAAQRYQLHSPVYHLVTPFVTVQRGLETA